MYEPTAEMIEFARAAVDTHRSNQAGTTTDADIERLEQLGARATTAQKAANAAADRQR